MTDLPYVSIITPTYNKKSFFPLALHNFNSIDYPPEKLEWIIIDDSDESIKDLIPNDKRIKYYYYSKENIEELHKLFVENCRKKRAEYKKLSKKNKKGHKYKLLSIHKKHFKGNRIPLGMKRNLAVQYTNYKYIVHMDDDDFYHPKSVLTRINTMLETKSTCVGCSTIGCFHINKLISIIYKPDEKYSAAKKISVATLAYTREYWDLHRFENQDIINEGEYFLKNRKFNEIHWKDVIVALFHSLNDRNLKSFRGEPNGWHYYPLSDELFTMLTSLDDKNTNQYLDAIKENNEEE